MKRQRDPRGAGLPVELDPIASLRQVVARGQAAQRAVDQVLADHSQEASDPGNLVLRAADAFNRQLDADGFPPWRRCSADGCADDTGRARWTRGAFCPQHRVALRPPAGTRGVREAAGGEQHPARAAGSSTAARAGTKGRRL